MLRDVAMATMGAAWRMRLNRPCATVMRGLMSNYFDHLF